MAFRTLVASEEEEEQKEEKDNDDINFVVQCTHDGNFVVLSADATELDLILQFYQFVLLDHMVEDISIHLVWIQENDTRNSKEMKELVKNLR